MIYKVCCKNEKTGFGIFIICKSLNAAKARAAKWGKEFPNNRTWIAH
jgi:hypothetical protein